MRPNLSGSGFLQVLTSRDHGEKSNVEEIISEVITIMHSTTLKSFNTGNSI